MIPSIDLLDGRAVVLVGGRRETEDVVSDRPVDLALSWQRRGAKRLHVVDLNAAWGMGDNREVIRSILRAVAIPVQTGGGLRDEDALRAVFAWGASRALVGTRAVQEPDWLRAMTVRFPGRLILALDRDERGVVIDGWRRVAAVDPRKLIDLANRLPLTGVLFTDVGSEGRLRGMKDIPRDLVQRCLRERIAAGGATTVEDLRNLRDAGFDHAVVGKALYSGALDFAQAQEVMP